MENLRNENQGLDRDRGTSKKRVLTGMFRDRESTERAYNTLNEKGYSKEEINLIMSKEYNTPHLLDQKYQLLS